MNEEVIIEYIIQESFRTYLLKDKDKSIKERSAEDYINCINKYCKNDDINWIELLDKIDKIIDNTKESILENLDGKYQHYGKTPFNHFKHYKDFIVKNLKNNRMNLNG